MAEDPRQLVLAEMRKQTDLLTDIHNLLVDVLDKLDGQPAASSAPNVDLDGQYGDPVVKAKSPKNWSGENMTGRRFSECPAEYLDQVADRAEHFARKNAEAGDDTKAGYDRRDAARARGWAARLRGGWKPAEPTPMAAGGYAGDDFAADAEPRW